MDDMEHNGEPFDSGSGSGSAGEAGIELPTPAPEAAAPQPSTAAGLAAWGRGERELAFHELEKAINDYIFDKVWKIVEPRLVTIKSRAEALDFLIDEGIISLLEARGDV